MVGFFPLKAGESQLTQLNRPTARKQHSKAGVEVVAESPWGLLWRAPGAVYFAGKDAEKLFCCANCWPVSHLISVDVLEIRAHLLA